MWNNPKSCTSNKVFFISFYNTAYIQIYKYYIFIHTKYIQPLVKICRKTCAPNCESEVNYIVEHALNFKQLIVDCPLKCLNLIEKC